MRKLLPLCLMLLMTLALSCCQSSEDEVDEVSSSQLSYLDIDKNTNLSNLTIEDAPIILEAYNRLTPIEEDGTISFKEHSPKNVNISDHLFALVKTLFETNSKTRTSDTITLGSGENDCFAHTLLNVLKMRGLNLTKKDIDNYLKRMATNSEEGILLEEIPTVLGPLFDFEFLSVSEALSSKYNFYTSDNGYFGVIGIVMTNGECHSVTVLAFWGNMVFVRDDQRADDLYEGEGCMGPISILNFECFYKLRKLHRDATF